MVKYKAYGWLEVLLPGQTIWLAAFPSGLLMPVYQEFEVLAVSLLNCFSVWPSAHHVLIVFHLPYRYGQQQTSKTECVTRSSARAPVL